jgi:hypothetical protein
LSGFCALLRQWRGCSLKYKPEANLRLAKAKLKPGSEPTAANQGGSKRVKASQA